MLLNFRQVANLTGQKPSQVAMTYLLKHIQSLAIAVKTDEYFWAWTDGNKEGLKQRIADARNYLLLLAACLDEEDNAKRDAMQKILDEKFNKCDKNYSEEEERMYKEMLDHDQNIHRR